ncbi:MAG: hypothetical protein WBW73_24000, partial [Rhodoplanes sp.]
CLIAKSLGRSLLKLLLWSFVVAMSRLPIANCGQHRQSYGSGLIFFSGGSLMEYRGRFLYWRSQCFLDVIVADQPLNVGTSKARTHKATKFGGQSAVDCSELVGNLIDVIIVPPA